MCDVSVQCHWSTVDSAVHWDMFNEHSGDPMPFYDEEEIFSSDDKCNGDSEFEDASSYYSDESYMDIRLPRLDYQLIAKLFTYNMYNSGNSGESDPISDPIREKKYRFWVKIVIFIYLLREMSPRGWCDKGNKWEFIEDYSTLL